MSTGLCEWERLLLRMPEASEQKSSPVKPNQASSAGGGPAAPGCWPSGFPPVVTQDGKTHPRWAPRLVCTGDDILAVASDASVGRQCGWTASEAESRALSCVTGDGWRTEEAKATPLHSRRDIPKEAGGTPRAVPSQPRDPNSPQKMRFVWRERKQLPRVAFARSASVCQAQLSQPTPR